MNTNLLSEVQGQAAECGLGGGWPSGVQKPGLAWIWARIFNPPGFNLNPPGFMFKPPGSSQGRILKARKRNTYTVFSVFEFSMLKGFSSAHMFLKP